MKNLICLCCLIFSVIMSGAACTVATEDRSTSGSGGASQSGNKKNDEKAETVNREKPIDDRDAGGDAEAKANKKKPATGGDGFEMRCGWYENPTPANHFLTDADDEWVIGVQGGHQADGDYPVFADNDWVVTNGTYGYGCACMNVKVNRAKSEIVSIKNAKARPLSACRSDKALREPAG